MECEFWAFYVEIFCRIVFMKKCFGWVVGHLFTSGMAHREEEVAALWDLHGSRALQKPRRSLWGTHGWFQRNRDGAIVTKQAHAFQLLTAKSVLKNTKWQLRQWEKSLISNYLQQDLFLKIHHDKLRQRGKSLWDSPSSCRSTCQNLMFSWTSMVWLQAITTLAFNPCLFVSPRSAFVFASFLLLLPPHSIPFSIPFLYI